MQEIIKNRKIFRISIICIFWIYVLVAFAFAVVTFNFPKTFYLNEFRKELICNPLVISIFLFIIENIVLIYFLRSINKVIKLNNKNSNTLEYKKILLKARDDGMNNPFCYNIVHILVIIIIVIFSIVFFKVKHLQIDEISSKIKLLLLFISIYGTYSIVAYSCIRIYCDFFVRESYKNNLFYRKPNNIKNNVVTINLQIIPVIVAIFTVLVNFSYSRIVKNNEKARVTYYKKILNKIEINTSNISSQYLLNMLKNKIELIDNDEILIIDPYDNIITSDNKSISNFMLKYKDNYFNYIINENNEIEINDNTEYNIIYDKPTVDNRAFLRKVIDINGNEYFFGIKFYSGDTDSLVFLGITGFIVLLLDLLIFIIWTKNNSVFLKRIQEYMRLILIDENTTQKNYLPVLSNDELGMISYYYNQIHNKIKIQQDIMYKQEQLVVIGEIAGGIVHDINTPISTIKSGIFMLKEDLNNIKYNEILSNMDISANRIIELSNSMRNQVRNLGENSKEKFNLKSLVEELNVITNNEQKKSGCIFEREVEDNIIIYGEKLKLSQVLTNIIVNDFQAYKINNKKGKIKLKAFVKSNNLCRIEIEDEAGGIPERIQKNLFKSIVTTKGKDGTGLGLYLSASIIKGIYQGSINFIVQKDIGTTFFIEIPMNLDME